MPIVSQSKRLSWYETVVMQREHAMTEFYARHDGEYIKLIQINENVWQSVDFTVGI